MLRVQFPDAGRNDNNVIYQHEEETGNDGSLNINKMIYSDCQDSHEKF